MLFNPGSQGAVRKERQCKMELVGGLANVFDPYDIGVSSREHRSRFVAVRIEVISKFGFANHFYSNVSL
jgi:hypothetical protein